jgi:hypothetical protein
MGAFLSMGKEERTRRPCGDPRPADDAAVP